MSNLVSVPPTIAAADVAPAAPESRPLPTHVSELDALRLDNLATKRQSLNAQAGMLAAQAALIQERQGALRAQLARLEKEFSGLQAHLFATYGVTAGDEIDVGTCTINHKA